MEMPQSLGLIVLEDCFHFPFCTMPLFIFEQRYRVMLAAALEGSRMFGVGCLHRGELLPVATLGLVRACKTMPDGTSHVMLQGLSRVRVTGWQQTQPHRIATVEAMPTSVDSEPAQLQQWRQRALACLEPLAADCGEAMGELLAVLRQMECAEAACDLMAYHFVRDGDAAASLLQETSLSRRYEILLEVLESA
jgi:Lon protease-like protein